MRAHRVAALNVGGQTIHSLFGLRVGVQDVTRISRTMSRETREVLAAVDTVIVDEVSMVSADLLDAMDRSLRVAKRRSRAPFGGAQLIMFGDPYQLAPVPPRTPTSARSTPTATRASGSSTHRCGRRRR